MTANFPIYLLVMAGVTYLIRMLPLTIFRKEISTGDLRTAAVGFVVAVILAWKGKSLLTVALAACAAVLAAQGILLLF